MKTNKLRRALGIVIAAVMVFAMVPAMAMADENDPVVTYGDDISCVIFTNDEVGDSVASGAHVAAGTGLKFTYTGNGINPQWTMKPVPSSGYNITFDKKSISFRLPNENINVTVSAEVEPTLDEALNVEGGTIHFTSDGTYPWITKDDTERTYAQSGNAEKPMSSSELTAKVNLAGAGTLSFDYKARGEGAGNGTPFDECLFAVD
ncbi:MAG: hypothetical protein IJS35_00705, partial [Firmicutes bacterium]|nr:hypothetical protein [Bacillota bacterium]